VIARADGLGNAVAVVADPFGDFIVSDFTGNRVWWATTDGRKQVVTAEIPNPTGLGWDIYSNLIIIGPHGAYRKFRGGSVTQMFAEDGLADVALAPDGTLWFTDKQPSSLRRYDALGRLLSVDLVPVSAAPNQIAINAAGAVYFTVNTAAGGAQVYRLLVNNVQLVFNTPWSISDFAFDEPGNFYVTSDSDSRVYRYSPLGAPLDAPLATANVPTAVAFARAPDGAMTTRLFVLESGGRLVELASTATREAGAPVGFATVSQVIGDLLRPGNGLTDAQRQVLDSFGNRNGRYDVGDLRAFFTLNGTLSQMYAY